MAQYLSTILDPGTNFVILHRAGLPVAPVIRGGKSEHRSAA